MNTHDKYELPELPFSSRASQADYILGNKDEHNAEDMQAYARSAIEPYVKRVAELEAARIAYASEFEPDENGEPDVGSIHENIRKLKADRKRGGEPVAITNERGGLDWIPGKRRYTQVGDMLYTAPQPAAPNDEVAAMEAVMESIDPATWPGLSAAQRCALGRFAKPRPAEPVNEEELLAAREALIDMGYLWDGDQWVEVDPPSKTAEQAPEWPDFARMEASLQRLKERLVFENGRRKDLEQRLREKRNG